MRQCFVELSLLLQDGRQVGMGGGKLWEDFESFQVEAGRVLDVALLALDVGQVVQRIGVRRIQSEIKITI